MSQDQELDLSAPYLLGKVLITNREGTEFEVPPADFEQVEGPAEAPGEPPAATDNCGGQVVVTERGNRDYAWFYLENNSNRTANVTIERQWNYRGQRLRDRQRHRLYPGQQSNVMNFPRNQRPAVYIVFCDLE